MAFPARLEQLLEEDRAAIRSFVRIDFPGQPYGFWNGPWVITYAGLAYIPNHLAKVEEPDFSTGLEASDFSVEMPEAPGFGVTAETFVEIEAMPYKGAPIFVSDAYFDPDTGDLLHVEPMLAGYVDTVEHVRSGGESKLVGKCHTDSLDNHREGNVASGNEHQQLVSPGDRFFEHAGTTRYESRTVVFDQ